MNKISLKKENHSKRGDGISNSMFCQKRVVSLVICMALTITMSGFSKLSVAKAEENSEIQYEYSASGEIKPTIPQKGDGTEESPYLISTAEELFGFAAIINGDKSICDGENVKQNTGANAKLEADIDLMKKEWIPIGRKDKSGDTGWSYDNSFLGNFDGDGHTIKNMIIKNDDENTGAGFFGCVGNDSGNKICIKNLTIGEGSSVKAKKSAAAFVGESTSSSDVYIDNCVNMADVTIDTDYSDGTDAGSMAGTSLGWLYVTNCMNTGNITAPKCVTAVAGWMRAGYVTGFFNTGKVVSSTGHYDELTSSSGDFFARGNSVSCRYNVSAENDVNFKSNKCSVMSEKEIFSGKAAYVLNGAVNSFSEDNQPNWGQNLAQDNMPVLYKKGQKVPDSSVVYYGYKNCQARSKIYSNDAVIGKHGMAGHLFKDESGNAVDKCVYCGENKKTDSYSYDKPSKVTEQNMKEYGLDESYIGYYAIKTASELRWFSAFTNGDYYSESSTEEKNESNKNNANVVLLADIDLSGEKWIPIKDYYKGTFDGKNHVISNMIFSDNSYYAGMIRGVDDDGVIKNLGLENVDIRGNYSTGAFASYSYGLIINCYSTGNVKDSYDYGTVGGICGSNLGSIKFCYSLCVLNGTYTYGIASGGDYYNCYALSDYESTSEAPATTSEAPAATSEAPAATSEAPVAGGYSLGELLDNAAVMAAVTANTAVTQGGRFR